LNSGLMVSDLSVNYGAVNAIHDLSFQIHPGELVAVIGANGAGKSTLIRTLAGLVAPSGGAAQWNGTSLLGQKPEELVRLGIVHISEGRSVIPELTVSENLALGGLWRRDKKDVALALRQTLDIFPALANRLSQRADSLSGGERQMLAIGRALISRPKLLLLDEPSLGLAPLIIEEIFRVLNQLRSQFGLTVLLVEQNARSALKIADRGLILNLGVLVSSGISADLIADPQLAATYLGF
jgi:branched-chain amino acid transport system ATP-binding protein